MLKDITVPSETITIADTTFTVQGLTLADLTDLLQSHQEAITALFNGERTLGTVLEESPQLAASMVARAAGEPDAADTVARLPVGVQLTALEHVWDLTVPDEEALGKVVSRVANVVEQVQSNPATSTTNNVTDTSGSDN